MITSEMARNLTQMSLENELGQLINNYMKVYDDYYSPNSTRDSAFLKDLVDAIKGISACLDVYVNHDKNIHPQYALEKLEWSKRRVDGCISYYEYKLNELEKEDEWE